MNIPKSRFLYFKIEVIYVIKIPVCSKSIPKPRIIPKSRFYCTDIVTELLIPLPVQMVRITQLLLKLF